MIRRNLWIIGVVMFVVWGHRKESGAVVMLMYTKSIQVHRVMRTYSPLWCMYVHLYTPARNKKETFTQRVAQTIMYFINHLSQSLLVVNLPVYVFSQTFFQTYNGLVYFLLPSNVQLKSQPFKKSLQKSLKLFLK